MAVAQAHSITLAIMSSCVTGVAFALRYVDSHYRVTEGYPYNSNGSADGIAGVTSDVGRVTLMTPHPERHIWLNESRPMPDPY